MSQGYHLQQLSSKQDSNVGVHDVALPTPSELAHDSPQETWLVRDRQDRVVACASLWCNETASLGSRRCGYIGHYRATDRQAADDLLSHICARLRHRGCGFAVGPINGSTWHDYRLVTGGADRPAFFLEPQNPAAWVDDMADAGFSPIATYHSNIVTDLDYEDPSVTRIERRLAQSGVTLHRLDKSRLKAELRSIYQLAQECFANNFLYTPIPESAFESAYFELAERNDCRHVVLAEQDDRLVGFAFAIPDYAQGQTGNPIDTLVLKTMAVAPGRTFAGLGRVLFHEIHQDARSCGYQAVIHALMHDANASAAASRRYAKPVRQYALFGKALA